MLNAETYITPQEGIGGKIRTTYEDFNVEEIPERIPSGKGPNIWIFIEKVGRNTLDVVLDMARILRISRKRMGFAGMKDRRAVTRQWICVSNIDLPKILELEEKLHNVKILSILPNEKKLRIGQLIGNKFRILIRDVINRESAVETANNVFEILLKTGVPNYYGWQRFGSPRTNTHLVGRALIENDLKKAVDSYIGNPYDREPDYIKDARNLYDKDDVVGSYELMPSNMRYERMMLRVLIKELKKKETLDEYSYLKAIESLPKPLKRMFVHAYQSYLFNKAVSERAKLGIDKYIEGDILIDNEEHLIHNFDIQKIDEIIKKFQAHPTAPLYGTKVPFATGKIGEIEKDILSSENISKKDFEVPKMPKLGSHGLRRSIRFKIWDASATSTHEGLMVDFSIPKGCYATAVLRELMKNEVV